ncbi:MAG: uroporphyrinogen-III synthase [Candidatus Bathyarchaeota archaeon]|nr:uroporphyrinogen-III synthase [Candidatus Bathyarchaeota archaeon]
MVQDKLTLRGKTVALTRPRDQATETGKLVEKYQGKPYYIPSIEITPTYDIEAVNTFFNALKNRKVDLVVFMSVNGIKYLLRCAQALEQETVLMDGLQKTVIMAVGPKTASALKTYNLNVGLVPEEYSSTGILQCLQDYGVSAKLIYIPRTRGATAELSNSLKKLGANVQEVYVYESKLVQNNESAKQFLQDLVDKKIDAIIFGSSLSAKHLFQMLETYISQKKLLDLVNDNLTVVAIGPVTAKTLTKLGLNVDVMPDTYLFEKALDALAQYWAV